MNDANAQVAFDITVCVTFFELKYLLFMAKYSNFSVFKIDFPLSVTLRLLTCTSLEIFQPSIFFWRDCKNRNLILLSLINFH